MTSDVLLRIARLQHTDSTSFRAGLNLSMNSFLDELTQSTAYLADKMQESVESALLQTTSLFRDAAGASASVELESVIQKWLGVFYNEGGSSSTVNSLASALNRLGTGDVSQLGNGTGLLLTRAIAESGLSVADIMNNGLSAQSADSILRNAFKYMTDAGSSSSNIIKNQFANLYGVGIDDLIAASNIGRYTSFNGGLYDSANSLIDTFTDWTSKDRIISRTSTLQSLDNWYNNQWFGVGSYVTGDQSRLLNYYLGGKISDFAGDSFLGQMLGSTMQQQALRGGIDQVAQQIINMKGTSDNELSYISQNVANFSESVATGIKYVSNIANSLNGLIGFIVGWLSNQFDLDDAVFGKEAYTDYLDRFNNGSILNFNDGISDPRANGD